MSLDISVVIINEIQRLRDNEIIINLLNTSDPQCVVVPLFYWPSYYKQELFYTKYPRVGKFRKRSILQKLKLLESELEHYGMKLAICDSKETLRELFLSLLSNNNKVRVVRNRKNFGDIKFINNEIKHIVEEQENKNISMMAFPQETNFVNSLHEGLVRDIITRSPISNRSAFIRRSLEKNYFNSLLHEYINYKRKEKEILKKQEENNNNTAYKLVANLVSRVNKKSLSLFEGIEDKIGNSGYTTLTNWILDEEGRGLIYYKDRRLLAEPNSSRLSEYFCCGSISQIYVLLLVQYLSLRVHKLILGNHKNIGDQIKYVEEVLDTTTIDEFEILTEVTTKTITEDNYSLENFNKSINKFIEELGDTSFNQAYMYLYFTNKLPDNIKLLKRKCSDRNKSSKSINLLFSSKERSIRAILNELTSTGYISNRSRMLLCNYSFKTNHINYNHLLELLESYLIDYVEFSTLFGVYWSIGIFDNTSSNNNNDIMARQFSTSKFEIQNSSYINKYIGESINIYTSASQIMSDRREEDKVSKRIIQL